VRPGGVVRFGDTIIAGRDRVYERLAAEHRVPRA
jgi:hypothetical protein